jgi:hypothetical protein
MEHSGSERWVISHWNAAVASTPCSVGILGPVYNKMVLLNSFILTILAGSYKLATVRYDDYNSRKKVAHLRIMMLSSLDIYSLFKHVR